MFASELRSRGAHWKPILGVEDLKLSASFNAVAAPQAICPEPLMTTNACWRSLDEQSRQPFKPPAQMTRNAQNRRSLVVQDAVLRKWGPVPYTTGAALV